MHNPRGFTSAKRMLETCEYKEARLYHLAFTDAEQVKPYQEARKALCEELRRNKVRCQWRACIEADEKRGFHMHLFILLEAKLFNPDHILNRKSHGWLTTLATKLGIDFYINKPRDHIHLSESGTQYNYASLPKSKQNKLDNCIEWISYLYKNRSKEGLSKIYSSSRPSRAIKV